MVWLCLVGLVGLVFGLAYGRVRVRQERITSPSAAESEEERRKDAHREVRELLAQLQELKDAAVAHDANVRTDLKTLERIVLGSIAEPAPEPSRPAKGHHPLIKLPAAAVEVAKDEHETISGLGDLDDEPEDERTVVRAREPELGSGLVFAALHDLEQARNLSGVATQARADALLKLGPVAKVLAVIGEVDNLVAKDGQQDASLVGGLLTARMLARRPERSTIHPPVSAALSEPA